MAYAIFLRKKPTLVAVCAAVAPLTFGSLCLTLPAAAAQRPVVLAPHRAVYDLSLKSARPGASVTDVHGRLVLEIQGSACDGYTQNMRFVTQSQSSEGEPTVSDLRSTTFEDATATHFRFTGTELRDDKPGDAAAGEASRPTLAGPLKVDIQQPEKKTVSFPGKVYLPAQHSMALIAAGRSGVKRIDVDLYEGSELGDKVHETTATIGAEIPPGGNKKLPALTNGERLDPLASWPVNISYYEKATSSQDAAPIYEVSFVFYENGVSRKIVFDYGEFALSGDLREITFLEPNPNAEKCAAELAK